MEVMEEETNGWLDGESDGRTEGGMVGWMEGERDEWMNRA